MDMAVAFDFEFAQELCDQVAKELGFICSFMGDRGNVTASSARERIGKVHDGAARIMRGEINEFIATAEDAARSTGMRRDRRGCARALASASTSKVNCGLVWPLPVPWSRSLRLPDSS